MGRFFGATTSPTGGDPTHVRRSRVPVGKCYLPHEGERTVTTTDRPVLFDADERPIYRKAGFR